MDLQRAIELIESQLAIPSEQSIEPVLFVLVGLPGTGKSTLARALAHVLPVAVVESDMVRKLLFPHPTYTGPENRIMHGAAHVVVRRLLQQGTSVVSDATNLFKFHRELLYKIAAQCDARLLIVHVVAPEEIVQQRLEQRQVARDPHDLSEATWEVYQRMQKNQDPISRPFITVYADGDLSQAVNKILRAVRQIGA